MKGYKLKVTLTGSKPPIWRTFVLPEKLAVREMVDVFARVMGWRNSEHDPAWLARFEFPDAGTVFESDGTAEDGGALRWEESPVEKKMPGVTVQEMKPREIDADEPLAGDLLAAAAAGSGEFSYIFRPDAGKWEHRVRILKVVENAPAYPDLLNHSGECPPASYEGGIFKYQALSKKERRQLQEGHFPYRRDMVADRLKGYYYVGDERDKDGLKGVTKIKINEDDMASVFEKWMEQRCAEAPEHVSFMYGLERYTDESIPILLERWEVPEVEYKDLSPQEQRELVVAKMTEGDMLERYLRAVSDVEWQSIKNAIEWDKPLYYLLPGEDDFSRLWVEAYIFCTDCKEIQTPDPIREIFPRLDGDQFFQKRRREVSWVRDCAEFASEFYGFTAIGKLTEFCNHKPGTRLTEEQVWAILEDITPVQRNYYLDAEKGEVVSRKIRGKVEKLRAAVPEGLPYAPFSYEHVGKQHGDMAFPDDPVALGVVEHRLRTFYGDAYNERMSEKVLTLLGQSVPAQETAEHLLEGLRDILPEYLGGKTAEEASGFLKAVLALGRTVRCMALRGWTQEEVEKGEFPKKFK